jgi:hypothetical protein
MLHHRNIPLYLWGEAIQIAAYILNHTYTCLRPDSTPYEAWFGIKPSLAHTQIFGSDAFIHVPKEKINKFDSKSHPCIFLGYSDESKMYRVWNKVTKRVSITRYILFHENTTTPFESTASSTYVPLFPTDAPLLPPVQAEAPAPSNQVSTTIIAHNDHIASSQPSSSATAPPAPTSNSSPTTPRHSRPQHIRKLVQFHGDWANLATSTVIEPKT